MYSECQSDTCKIQTILLEDEGNTRFNCLRSLCIHIFLIKFFEVIYTFLNFKGLIPTCFLKKLLKCVTSVKPRA